jgi:carboxyl-terminal processing protease
VKNTGKGEAKESTAILRNASGDDLRLEKARFELGLLKPGQEQTVEFSFETAPSMTSPEAVVELTVYDSVLRESVGEKLKYPVQSDLKGPEAGSGAVRAQKAAAIYEGASKSSAQIASATKGSVFDVTGRLGEWYRVKLGENRPGFLHEDDVNKARSTGKLASFEPRWQVTPPTIQLKLPSLVSQGATYDLRGSASDDSKVEDVYIFVSNPDAKIDNKKVFYQNNRKGQSKTQMAFGAQIPLWPGSNAVTVVARENDEVRSSQTIFLYRENTRTAVAKP